MWKFINAILFFLVGVVLSDTEFCVKTNYEPIFWLNASHCPFGVLFPEPVFVDCFSTTETGEILADVCSSTPVDGSSTPIKFQYIPEFNGGPIEDKTCNTLEACGSKGLHPANWTSAIRPPAPPFVELEWPEGAETGGNYTADATVFNQTERLFRHLLGFVDADEGPASLRLVTLLKKSFQIMTKFCGEKKFVPPEFGQDVEQGFLFLLAESIWSKLVDIPLEDFRRVDTALNHCLNQKKPFRFLGSSCKRFPMINAINYTRTGELIPYKFDEFSWTPDKYDIAADVSWTAMDFVHGLCYGTFKEHVNSHHLYQQAMERLFLPEIIYRWDKPIRLARQTVWDNFFSANVRSAIRNLEHCVQAAYYDAPFLHRLERMLLKFTGGSSNATDSTRKRRRRRGTSILPKYEQVQFYCFNDATERDETLEQVKTSSCNSA